MKKERIAANVVTYNRKDLLKECLNSLLSQTRKPDSIIIVDNNSNDGTKEMLEKEFLDNPIFDYVRLDENTGSAGGQYTGIKRAYEKGFDWIWVMDDDGIAEDSQLEKLLVTAKKNNLQMVGPIILDKNRKDTLAFPIKNLKTIEEIKKNVESDIFIGFLNPFNGTLIYRKIISQIGNVKKEMFIWGDEREFFLRAKKNKVPLGTVLTAKHYHPADRMKTTSLPFKLGGVFIEPPERAYIFWRNTGYIKRKFSPTFGLCSILAYTFYFLSKLEIKKLFLFYRYFFDGFFNLYKLPINKQEHPYQTKPNKEE